MQQSNGFRHQSLDSIPDKKTIDYNVYVVVHTASDYVSMDQLHSDFITSFTLGNITELRISPGGVRIDFFDI